MSVKYLVSGKDGDHLPYTAADGEPDHRLMGAAWAALYSPNGFQGNKYSGPDKDAATAKLKALYKSEGMTTPSESYSDGVLDGQWIEIFRAGDYGDKGNFTDSDLDTIASSYDPAHHEAPVVIGHPETDAPAYGWISALKRKGSMLFAQLKQVSPKLEEMLRSGELKKRSAAFYMQPLSLRHVGFLGAAAPHVKGMADLKFKDGDYKSFEFEEEQMQADEIKKGFMESLKEFFGGSSSAGARTFSEADLEKAAAAAAKPFETTIAELTKQFTELKAEHAKTAAALSSASVVELAETEVRKLKDAKKWIPAFDKMGVPSIFAELAGSKATVEFGEGDKKTQKPMLQVFSDFLAGLKEIVPSGEIVGAAAAAKKGGKLVQFNEPANGNTVIDPQSVEMAEAAQELATKEKISFGDALNRVRKQRSQTGAA
jgi:hypothetical protein